MNYYIETYTDSEFHNKIWNNIISSSELGWCWHSLLWKKFVIESASRHMPIDLSFIVFDDNKNPIAICPLIIVNTTRNGKHFREASYNGQGLPWPCVQNNIANTAEIYSFIFSKAEEIVKMALADYIIFSSSSPFLTPSRILQTYDIINQHHYLDISHDSSVVNVKTTTILNIRDRYKRNIRKYAESFPIEILRGTQVSDAIEEAYFYLHVKDAGAQYRSRTSYKYFCDLARNDEAFLVISRNRENEKICGVLIVSLMKGAAYDSSVAVDPEYAQYFISHLMKWGAIEYLRTLNVDHYDLGTKFCITNWTIMPSIKQIGITNFKEGFARGSKKNILVAEKYLSKSALKAHCYEKMKQLNKFFFSHLRNE